MKKRLLGIALILTCIISVITLTACGGENGNGNNPISEVMPTGIEVITAQKNAQNSVLQNYDFKLNVNGNISLSGISASANANYDAKYRFNKNNGNLKFTRTTSGSLLYDSTSYIYNQGISKFKIVTDKDGSAKKVSVVTDEDTNIELINAPFAALMNSLTADNIIGVSKSDLKSYKYKTNLRLTSDNSAINSILSAIGNIGTSLEMGDVSITNPVSGVGLYFNIDNDNKLTDFKLSTEISFPFKLTNITLTLTYSQNANNADIRLPSTDSVIVNRNTIESELNSINSALNATKNSDAYSMDIEAVNEFNPGWNHVATVDKYISRLYKNKLKGFTAFNNSYEYKSHTENEGAETFKYTIGNLADGSVHQISRKGTNKATDLPASVSAESRFEYLTDTVHRNAADVECIKKTICEDITTYDIYLNKSATLLCKNSIENIINSNDASGVTKVENFFNSENYKIQDSVMRVEMSNGKLKNIELKTEIKYCPISGEYTENNITLTNTIKIDINEKINIAREYSAPSSVGNTIGLGSTKYYIL